jgi:hypothetical protein
MANVKAVTITMTEQDLENAQKISKTLLGKKNVSGLFVFFINQNKHLIKEGEKNERK